MPIISRRHAKRPHLFFHFFRSIRSTSRQIWSFELLFYFQKTTLEERLSHHTTL